MSVAVDMKVVLNVVTVMSLISMTKGRDCKHYFPETITINETSIAGTQLHLLDISEGEEWRFSYDPFVFRRGDQLRDYYRGVLRFVPAYNKNSHKCRVQAGSTHCKLVLAKPLDAEVIFQLESNDRNALKASYVLSCVVSSSVLQSPLKLTVAPVNEFAPEFNDSLRSVSITALTRRNTVITDLKDSVYDRDRFIGGGVQDISLVNGTDWLRLDGTKVVLTKEIQFDELVQSRQTRPWFQLSAKDSEGRVGKGLMIVHIEDVDIHPPYFSSLGCERLQPHNCSHPFYTADVLYHFTGDVDSIRPAQILAEDGDIMLNATIRYSFLENEYSDYVQMNGQTGTVRVVAALTKFRDSTINFTVVATEDTDKKHHSVAVLLVHVLSESVAKDHSTVVPATKDHSTVVPATKDHSTVVPVRKDQSTMVTTFTLSVGFIIVVVVAVVVYFTHNRKKSREETGQREEERRNLDSLQAESPIVPAEPFSTGETQELTSEVTESSADPSTFENESEVDYDNEYSTTSENESEVDYDNEYDNE